MKYLLCILLGALLGILATKIDPHSEVKITDSFNTVSVPKANPAEPPWTGDLYEYTNVWFSVGSRSDKMTAQLGLYGWELVAATDDRGFYFKRKLTRQ